MDICVTTVIGVSRYGLEKCCKILKDIGYDGVDYTQMLVSYRPFSGLFSLSDDEFYAFHEREYEYAKKADIRIMQTHAPFPTYGATSEEAKYIDDALIKAIRVSSLMKAKYMILHPSMPDGWSSSNVDYDRALEANVLMMKKLKPYAEKYGVGICMENMPGKGVTGSTPEEILSYLCEAGDDSVFSACLDTGHAFTAGYEPAAFVEKLGTHLKALHIHDNNGSADSHQFPYMGKINWDLFFKALKSSGYGGTFNYELSDQARYPGELYMCAEKFAYSLAKQFIEIYDL